MRNFANDKPQFMVFTLGKSKKQHKIPLAASLPMEISMRFAEVSLMPDSPEKNMQSLLLQRDLVERYVGDEAKNLSLKQVQEIFEAWGEESSRNGQSPGE